MHIWPTMTTVAAEVAPIALALPLRIKAHAVHPAKSLPIAFNAILLVPECLATNVTTAIPGAV